jgi:hypothetical protein
LARPGRPARGIVRRCPASRTAVPRECRRQRRPDTTRRRRRPRASDRRAGNGWRTNAQSPRRLVPPGDGGVNGDSRLSAVLLVTPPTIPHDAGQRPPAARPAPGRRTRHRWARALPHPCRHEGARRGSGRREGRLRGPPSRSPEPTNRATTGASPAGPHRCRCRIAETEIVTDALWFLKDAAGYERLSEDDQNAD